MQLDPGTTLGHYEILSSLGAGGMGEVYRAKDTKLGREVAIKLLLEEVSADPERLARFEREAKVLASLNHNNIATLYGFEQEGDTNYLVMELVAGETLADRIARGPIPLNEAIPIFIQIAEGLEAAHASGVIHRDLKPANIKVDEDSVKILDFGLARASVEQPAAGGLSDSPTLTAPATGIGVMLGTAPYMAPEQARGLKIDACADVWAFGCCLFEALTGKRAFDGEAAIDTLSRVLEHEPDWSLLPSTTPTGVRNLLRRCLAKKLSQRWRNARDLAWALQDWPELEPGPDPTSLSKNRSGLLALAALTLLIVGVGSGFLAATRGRESLPETPRNSLRFTLPPQEQLGLEARFYRSLAISPDGSSVAFVTNNDGIVLSDLTTGSSRRLEGSEAGRGPVAFSPSGDWLVFRGKERSLHRVHLDEGTVESIESEYSFLPALDWVDETTIIASAPLEGRLLEFSFTTMTVTPLPDPEGREFWTLTRLEGGRRILGMSRPARSDSSQRSEDRVEIYDLDTNQRNVLAEPASFAWHVRSGHVVFAREGPGFTIAPLDQERSRLSGDPRSLPLPLAYSPSQPWALHLDVAANGTLAFLSGGQSSDAALVPALVGRDGNAETLSLPAGSYSKPRISPDGRRLAFTTFLDSAPHLFVADLERGIRGATVQADVRGYGWDPQGEDLYFIRRSSETTTIECCADDPSPEVLWQGQRTDWRSLVASSAGTTLLVAGEAVNLLSQEDGTLSRLLPDDGAGREPDVSQNGRWVAFESRRNLDTTSAGWQIFVTEQPGPMNPLLVSDTGGNHPKWSADGRTLFFLSTAGDAIMAVDFNPEDGPLSAPYRYLDVPPGAVALLDNHRNYDLAPDGRFLFLLGSSVPQQIHIVTDWASTLD